jgi:Holliday junction resolvasome RuvABC endonuclease subunit
LNFTIFQNKKEVFIIKILAFDQALIKTGVCTLDDGTIYHSLIDLSKTKDPTERRAIMRQMIQSRIKNNNPDLVVIEDVALQASAKTVIQLAQLQGAIIGACELFNIPYEIIKPTEWRKMLDFKQGRQVKRPELKQQAIDYVAEHYGENVSSDEADAMCIATAAWMRLEQNKITQED